MNRKMFLLAGLILTFILVAVVVPVMAQEATAEPQPVLTASTDLFVSSDFVVNVRSGPGTEYTVLDKLRPGSSVDITGRTADNNWLRVNWNGAEGWVSAGVVDITGDLNAAPEAVAGATAVLRSPGLGEATADPSSDNVVVITRFNTSLRAEPATSATRLAIIPFNTQLAVNARNADGTWVQVTYDGETGWVLASLLFFSQGTVDTLNAIDAAGNPVAIATPAAEATAEATSTP
jgi:uncharacterized protein YraI